MHITRIRIRDYRGIEALDTEIPPTGAIVRGSNGQAKTSVLKAIQAALAARDIGPDAIRGGADKAEILVDVGNLTVKRAITRRSTQLSVSQDMGGVKAKLPEPQAFLRNLLGSSALDPIEFVTQRDKKKRRAHVLAALPVRVTAEQIRQWTNEDCAVDPTAHGLEVVSQLRATYYDRRAEANARAKDLHARAQHVRERVAEMPAPPATLPSIDLATAVADQARAGLAQLDAQTRAAREAEEKTATMRARIQDLRDRARIETDGLSDPTPDALPQAEEVFEQWRVRVRELEAELAAAREGMSAADLHVRTTRANVERVAAARRRAESFAQQAAALESAIELASAQAPSEKDQQAAHEALSEALCSLEAARNAQITMVAYRTLVAENEQAEEAAARAQTEADKLDVIVHRLTEAPAALLASSDGIPGLTIEGDDVYLDGVNLDGLCGREQLRFAVEIARRANAKSRFLLVDGLERIAPEHIDEFVRLATADGWQLLATRVADGERVIEAIHPDSE